MSWSPPSIPMLLAEAASTAEAELQVDYFPLPFQILCIVFTALFVWIFCIARNPRGWRRLYQSKFCNPEDHSVNRNKWLDERIRKYGTYAAMVVLVLDVTCVVWGVTNRYRHSNQRPPANEEQPGTPEVERVQSSAKH